MPGDESSTICVLFLDNEYSSRSDKRELFEIRRLSLDSEASSLVSKTFDKATQRYTVDPVDYSPDYHLEEEQVFVIHDFPFPQKIINGLSNSASLEVQKHLGDGIKAIIVADEKCSTIAFQILDKSHQLMKKPCLILDDSTLRKNKKPGLILKESISCLYKDGNLYFKSYRSANTIFDLNMYLELASDEAIHSFMACPYLLFEDSNHFETTLNQKTRRNIALIEKAGILKKDFEDIRKVIDDNNLPIVIYDNKISIPKNKSDFNKVMSFFTENMFVTLFSKKNRVSNSSLTLSEPEK